MKLLYLENYNDLKDYQEFYGAELIFIDNFGWREVAWLTRNLCSASPKDITVRQFVTFTINLKTYMPKK